MIKTSQLDTLAKAKGVLTSTQSRIQDAVETGAWFNPRHRDEALSMLGLVAIRYPSLAGQCERLRCEVTTIKHCLIDMNL